MPLSYTLPNPITEDPGPEHNLFKQWVLEQDIIINGITPAKLPGRGIGIIAERNIEEGEELVVVPRDALLSTDSVIDEVKNAALDSGISVHGLLAMYLAITAQQEDDPYAEWRRVWPSRSDLATMPVQWPFSLRGLKKHALLGTWSPLPPSINGEWSPAAISDLRHAGLATSSSRLERQRRKIDKDWTRAKTLCEGQLEYEDYVYHWLVVNTRSFFFDETDDKDRYESRDDKMALCPFIDYFNHADGGCTVAYNENGYSVSADRPYLKGEELLVSYGDHDNDLLAVDYGFVLAENAADSVPLDDLVLFGPGGVYKKKELLNQHDYFGEYKIGVDGPCYRTQMAAAIKILDEPDWVKVVNGSRELSPEEKTKVDTIVRDKWLAAWSNEVRRALQAWGEPSMHDSKDVPDHARQMAVARWTQIEAIIKAGTKAMDS